MAYLAEHKDFHASWYLIGSCARHSASRSSDSTFCKKCVLVNVCVCVCVSYNERESVSAGQRGVLESLDHRQVGILQFRVLPNQSYLHLLLQGVVPINRTKPAM